MSLGFVLWEGPSEIDGSPIALIFTASRGNSKTRLPSLVILPGREILEPAADAARARSEGGKLYGRGSRGAGSLLLPLAMAGQDKGICGGCRHRYNPETGKRTCYVNLGQGVDITAKAYVSGAYVKLPWPAGAAMLRALTRHERLRFGSYGDPAAVPVRVYERLGIVGLDGSPGYTHRWRDLKGHSLRVMQRICMASVDTAEEYHAARAMGWRTFRVREIDSDGVPESILEGEAVCPAAHEAGKVLTCAACAQCDGLRKDGDKRPSRAIVRHDSGALRRRKARGDLSNANRAR